MVWQDCRPTLTKNLSSGASSPDHRRIQEFDRSNQANEEAIYECECLVKDEPASQHGCLVDLGLGFGGVDSGDCPLNGLLEVVVYRVIHVVDTPYGFSSVGVNVRRGGRSWRLGDPVTFRHVHPKTARSSSTITSTRRTSIADMSRACADSGFGNLSRDRTSFCVTVAGHQKRVTTTASMTRDSLSCSPKPPQ